MTNSYTCISPSSAVSGVRATWKVACFLIVLFLPSLSSLAQETVPEFSVDVVSTRSDTSQTLSHVDVYARIGYSKLIFQNTANGFTSSYEVSLAVIDAEAGSALRSLVQSKIWDGNIVVDTYSETQSDQHSDLTTQSLELPPGQYTFEFEVEDKNSDQFFVQEIPVEVRNFDKPFAISDLTLIESYDAASFTIVPRVGKSVATSDGGFQLFYEIFAESPREITIRREVFKTARDGSIPAAPAWMDLSSEQEDVIGAVFSDGEAIELASGKSQHVVPVPLEDIKAGAYIVRVSLEDAEGAILDSTEKTILVQWSGLAAHLQDLEVAIKQLEYTAKKSDIDFILDAPNQIERIQRFERFWEKRDPTPNTKRNERMEEYYYRVDSANRNYGAVQDGWKTDRGYVFVTYGEPDHVERQPFSFDYEPYEVWLYERMGRRFIFVDKTGFGDYELLVPVWDERSRLY